MYEYEELLEVGRNEGLSIKEMRLSSDSSALCKGKKIILNKKKLDTYVKKRCRLSEEIWHTRVTIGNITDLRDIRNLKQERFARIECFNELMPPDKIVKALLNYCGNIYDMCDYLGVTQEYFCEAITYYKQKYGLAYRCKDYTLYLEPLSVIGSSTQGDDLN